MRLSFIGILTTVILSLTTIAAFATHNRAGEITYEHQQGYTYKITITTYTKESAFADRPWLKIRWGDEPANVTESDLDSLQRVITDPTIAFDVQKNVYYGFHTYGGPGEFTLVVEDPNRNDGVNNIVASVNQIFCISTTLNISPLSGHNNSVVLLNDPIQDACIYQPWIYNPAAFDPDGDDLVYSLVPCMGASCIPLLGWDSPEEWTTETTDSFEIDPVTGTITWNTPLYSGEYNIAIKIEEFRNGNFVGSVIRDMQITVVTCNNQPPVVNPIPDYCVEAGDYLEFFVTASDPNGNSVSLQAFGGPLSNVDHPATFQPNIGKFTWTPQCEEVRNAPYTLTIQATDNGYIPLSNVQTTNIKVVAPRIENPVAEALGSSITLSWDVHSCQSIFTAFEASQVRYKIYRRNNLFGFNPSDCELGVPEYTGYTYLGETQGLNNTTFEDTGLQYGQVYCYMVVTCWPDGAESYASEEFCDTLRKDVPIMTKVSVALTDVLNGINDVCWSPPHELDTIAFPGPFYYEVYHAIGSGTPDELVYTSTVSPYLIWGDTCFTHLNVPTQNNSNNYSVRLIANGAESGRSRNASSVFLTTTPSDNSILLQMDFDVPWINHTYEIYRKDPGSSDFLFIATSTTPEYLDENLINNEEYCYKVKSIGSFYSNLITDPVENWSQEVCDEPYDNVPPCPPTLTIEDDCALFINELSWNNPNLTCADDVTGYNIYYSPSPNEDLQWIATLDGAENLTYNFPYEDFDFSIAGCYAVSALDSLNLWPDGSFVQNESELSAPVCIDNCPLYELPNVFTPNNDGVNDVLQPFPYRYVESIEFKIFNRWGVVVFETTDPDINWDGRNKDSKEISADGTYFYTVKVNTIRLIGIIPENYSGTITILDASQPPSSN